MKKLGSITLFIVGVFLVGYGFYMYGTEPSSINPQLWPRWFGVFNSSAKMFGMGISFGAGVPCFIGGMLLIRKNTYSYF